MDGVNSLQDGEEEEEDEEINGLFCVFFVLNNNDVISVHVFPVYKQRRSFFTASWPLNIFSV